MGNAADRNRDNVSLDKKLADLYDLIEGIEIAMFTTRRPDGRLVSRPMATQTQAEGSDLWFVTNIESNKLDELEFDPQVNLAYYRDRTREWVSVSGTAAISQDRRAIHELYRKDWKAWFGDEGGERDGGPGRSAPRADSRGRGIGHLSEGGQAAAGRAVRGREGDADRHPAGYREPAGGDGGGDRQRHSDKGR